MQNHTQSTETPGPDEQVSERDVKVPEWAENFEHTLRRLVREKDKERDKKAGLYR
ncbi:hypothetical protein [Defluviimonas sp. SAOS-178_SWC]|uniref:hypothetical protein n=1 Tax=Defluviimonas sp. SAOS-178_SWC TaxID=3121287 RepID=UPI0032221897